MITSVHIPTESGIYKFTSPSGKIYIGRAVNLRNRHYEHKRLRRRDTYLGRSLNKYGFEAHNFEVICIVPKVDILLNDLEKHYIQLYNSHKNGLNLTSGGDGTMGRIVSLAQKEKYKKTRQLNKIIPYNLGISPSQETRDKISATLKGNRLSQKSIDIGKQSMIDSGTSKPILDFNTGVYYLSIREASYCLGYWRGTLKRRLKKGTINHLKYV